MLPSRKSNYIFR